MAKISVIMSVYNDKIEYFKEAVESIRGQSYKEWEMIIVNDGDTTGCRKHVRGYKSWK